MKGRIEAIASGEVGRNLDELVPAEVLLAARDDIQKAIPALAKDPAATGSIERAAKRVPARHQLILGDSRQMDEIEDESVHLVLTSPPYWTMENLQRTSLPLNFSRVYSAMPAA